MKSIKLVIVVCLFALFAINTNGQNNFSTNVSTVSSGAATNNLIPSPGISQPSQQTNVSVQQTAQTPFIDPKDGLLVTPSVQNGGTVFIKVTSETIGGTEYEVTTTYPDRSCAPKTEIKIEKRRKDQKK